MLYQIIILLVLLVLAAFGLPYLPGDEGVKRLIRGIVILFAVLFVLFLILEAFGIAPNPFTIGAHGRC